MLREDVAHSPFDSGGIYGYQHDRPIKHATIYPSTYNRRTEWHALNTAHWLTANLTYDAASNRTLAALERGMHEAPWEDVITEWCALTGWIVRGSGNTYNDDTSLDRDFQYWILEREPDGEDMRVIIRSHNGCDARGGYSDPRVFIPADNDGWYFGPTDLKVEYYCETCGNDEPKRLTRAGGICGKCGGAMVADCSSLY